MPTELDEDAARHAVPPIVGNVAFEDVCFEYNPGQPVLKGVSFLAAAGTTTALGDAAIASMRAVKRAIDPAGRFAPGTIFPWP